MGDKKKKKDEKPQEEKKPLQSSQKIVRIFSTNIDSDMKVGRALTRIKGISFMFSNAICTINKIDPDAKIGSLDDGQMKNLEESIKNPNIPTWMLNRRKDPKTGGNMHIASSDIDMHLREDISTLKKMRSYKGIRHELGLPVRGQRTRSSFRKNKSVGVVKKKAAPQKKK